MLRVKTPNMNKIKQQIHKELDKLKTNKRITVGIHESAGNHEDDNLTNAKLGAILHYGADINHPGGTSYGYSTPSAAEKGQVRFMKKGTGFMELGVTKPHKIKIPARPWLDVGVASGNKEYISIIANGLESGLDPDFILNQIGVVAVSSVQIYMTQVKSPPNAKSTVKKKGSSNPLIDSGILRSSVTFELTSEQLNEGL